MQVGVLHWLLPTAAVAAAVAAAAQPTSLPAHQGAHAAAAVAAALAAAAVAAAVAAALAAAALATATNRRDCGLLGNALVPHGGPGKGRSLDKRGIPTVIVDVGVLLRRARNHPRQLRRHAATPLPNAVLKRLLLCRRLHLWEGRRLHQHVLP